MLHVLRDSFPRKVFLLRPLSAYSTTISARVRVVNDYADTQFFNSINFFTFIIIFYFLFGKYFARASVVDGYVDTRFLQISLRKQKISQNRFYLFIWGPGRAF